MKLKMTIDEALEFADEWSAGQTFHEDSQGWRVVCMLLAKEVRGLRVDRECWADVVRHAANELEAIDDMTAQSQAEALRALLGEAAP